MMCLGIYLCPLLLRLVPFTQILKIEAVNEI